MHTDKVPKKEETKQEYFRSDAMRVIDLPPMEPAHEHALLLKQGLANDSVKEVQAAGVAILAALAKAYNVKPPILKVLASRPRKVTENWVYETFGDYDPETTKIRLWMRTAVQKKATSYGTLLATLVHEFCHHLDMVSLEFPNTFHTRGFYERTALIYHHIQGTPVRRIVWSRQSDGTFMVDWPATMRGQAARR